MKMKFYLATSMFLFLLLSFNISAQNIWFSDEFNQARLKDAWFEISGKWEIKNGRLRLKAVDKPAFLGLNLLVPPNANYAIKFRFSGENVIVMFNVQELYSMRVGNYVKFFNNAIHTGTVDLNGEEIIKKFVSIPSALSKTGLKTMAIEVKSERYTVYYNGRKILDDKLYFNSGYIIIGVSSGDLEIDYFIVSSDGEYMTIENLKKIKKPLIANVNSIAIIDSSKFAISSDVYSQVQVVDTAGNLINRYAYLRWAGGVAYIEGGLYICDAGKINVVFPERTFNVAQFMVKYPYYIYADAEKFYIIDDGAIKIFDRNFRLISSFSDPDNLRYPTAVTSDKHNIYCTDPVLGHIAVYSKREVKFLGKIKGELIAPVDIKYDSTSNSLFVSDIGLKAVVKLAGGRVEKTYKAEKLGGLKFPRSIDLKSGVIFLADADKIIAVDTTLSEDKARLILK